MKKLKSTIMQDNCPVDDGMDLAFVYADANRNTLLQFLDKKMQALENKQKQLKVARENMAMAPGIIIAIISVLILYANYSNYQNITLGIVGILIGTGIAFLAKQKKKKKIAILEAEEQSILAWEPPPGVSHIGKINYMVNVIPFEDGKMVVDISGIQERIKVLYPEIPQSAQRLKEITESMKILPKELTVLLPAALKTELKDKDQLTGIESDLANILSLNRQLLDEKVDSIAEVPVFDVNSDVVHSLHCLSKYLDDENENAPSITISQPEDSVNRSLKELVSINENAKEIEKLGGQNDESMLQDVCTELNARVSRAKHIRDYSLIDILGKNLDELEPLYDYPMTRFYCPKCHKVPDYIAKTAPVPIDKLHENPIDQLNGFYKREEILRFRILSDQIRHHLDQALKSNEDLSSEHYRVLKNKLISYEEMMRNLALEIKDMDSRAEIHSRNAVLKYNTIQDNWKCQLCGETFTTEEAQWARMLKIKDDLILPMWDKLWLEKHDESMRILREKETELRKNKELESRQLREEANIFSQEYRAVRNHLEEANSSYQATLRQFEMMCDFFERRRILAPETIASLRNDIMDNPDSSMATGQIVEFSDKMEHHLEEEPETVFLRRGQLNDYTEETRNKNKYFTLSHRELFMIDDNIPGEED
ncbi:MAG TPA: hypothetical protein VK186_17165, partial [Candidatus Deferrimicrobium sp.]|nr:hypothetical protein [Candidatus Deferrimicrobium sp.]